MAKLVRRQGVMPDMLDWLDMPWATLLPFAPNQAFRVEDYVKDDRYVVRAELPGVDPDQDIEVTVTDGTLTIHAERHEEHKEPHHSEFRYGSFDRSVTLPERADTEHITARYDKGILEVSVPVAEVKPEGRKITVERSG
jgi:HSP20 family protein